MTKDKPGVTAPSKNAFTLAEFLVTLAVIGVLAAVTIPNFVNNTNDKANAVALKKVYNQLQYAVSQTIRNEYGNSFPLTELIGADELLDYYSQYIEFIKTCPRSGTTEEERTANCWNEEIYEWPYNSSGDKVAPVLVTTNGYSMKYSAGGVTREGYFIKWGNHNDGCDNPDYQEDGISLGCSRLYVDVNGKKGPNQFCKDIFHFITHWKGIVPYGAMGTSDELPTEAVIADDFACTAHVLATGNMDYE